MFRVRSARRFRATLSGVPRYGACTAGAPIRRAALASVLSKLASPSGLHGRPRDAARRPDPVLALPNPVRHGRNIGTLHRHSRQPGENPAQRPTLSAVESRYTLPSTHSASSSTVSGRNTSCRSIRRRARAACASSSFVRCRTTHSVIHHEHCVGAPRLWCRPASLPASSARPRSAGSRTSALGCCGRGHGKAGAGRSSTPSACSSTPGPAWCRPPVVPPTDAQRGE